MKTRQIAILIVIMALAVGALVVFSERPTGATGGPSSGVNLANTVSCQQVQTAVTLAVVASQIDSTTVWSYSTSAIAYSSTAYQNSTSVAEPIGTVVTTTHTESTFSSNVISEWTDLACTYVK
jgi:hypothetical protein